MREIIRRHRTDPIIGRPRPEDRPRRERSVKLLTLDYNDTAGEYLLTESSTTFSELPPGAVHVTGKKRTYFWDRVRSYEPNAGITASDLNLYMVNNSINDALAYRYDGKSMDVRKMLIYGIAAIVLVFVVFAMM